MYLILLLRPQANTIVLVCSAKSGIRRLSRENSVSFGQHLHHTSIRAHHWLHFLREAASVLDSRGRATVYKGFVRPLMDYSRLVWRGAAPTHLAKLDSVQARALRIFGKTTALQTLHARRTVAATAYLFKLRYLTPAARLRSMLPLPFTPPNVVGTRGQERTACQHPWQLRHQLQRNCPNYLKRSFPYSNINFGTLFQSLFFPMNQQQNILTCSNSK